MEIYYLFMELSVVGKKDKFVCCYESSIISFFVDAILVFCMYKLLFYIKIGW